MSWMAPIINIRSKAFNRLVESQRVKEEKVFMIQFQLVPSKIIRTAVLETQ